MSGELRERLQALDERILRLARTRWHDPARERAVARFSQLGEHGLVWVAIGAAGAAIDRPRRGRWLRAEAAVVSTYAVNTAIKLVVRRRRPRLRGLPPLVPTPTELSFPSAHASTSFAGAVSYAALGVPAAPLGALALGLPLSRLYLGVHYPSDVIAGAVLGTAIARLSRARPRAADHGWTAQSSPGEVPEPVLPSNGRRGPANGSGQWPASSAGAEGAAAE